MNNLVLYAAIGLAVVNMSWAIIGGVRDYRRRSELGIIEANFRTIERNIKVAGINVGLAAALIILDRILH